MGLALGALSIGAMEPLTVQYGPPLLAAALHRGSLNLIPDTGSPMAEAGMLPPSLAAAQSASVIVFDDPGACAPTPDTQRIAPAPALKTVHQCECFIIRRDLHT